MPLSPKLAIWLVKLGHDAVHANAIGLDRASDTKILEYARNEKRIVVTSDLDFPRLLALTEAEGPGLVLFRGGHYSEQEILLRLTRVFETISDKELPNSIVVIEKRRIRRRKLPLL